MFSMSVHRSLLILAVVFGAFIYFIEIRPIVELSKDLGPPVYSVFVAPDCWTYVRIAVTSSFIEEIQARHFNLLGPVSLIWLMGGNLTLVVMVYLSVFTLAVRAVHHCTGIPIAPFTLLLLLNPMIFISLLAPNKESMVVSALLFATAYGVSRHFKYFLFAIITALFARVELVGLLLLFFIFLRFKEKHILIGLMLLSISVVYSMLPGIDMRTDALIRGQTEQSAGIVTLLHGVAVDYFMYVLVVIPRLILNVLDGFLTLIRLREPSDILLYIPIVISGFLILVASYFTIVKSKFRWSDEVVLLVTLFCLLISLVPFVHHRYIMPVYPLLVILLMRPRYVYRGGTLS